MMTLIPLEPGTVKQRTFPFARYLMSVKLKRELATEEHVDHRDGDRTNDVISNLQVLTPTQNSEKGVNDPLRVLRRAENMYRFKCPHCGEWFEKQKSKSHLGKKGRSMTFCSRSCARYAYQHQGHKQEIEWIEPEKFEPSLQHEPWEKWSLNLPAKYTVKVKVSNAKVKVCDYCRKPFTGRRKGEKQYCSKACLDRAKAREVPNKRRMEAIMKNILAGKTSFAAVGRSYGKSDNAVRKWAKKYGLL
jgi:hypothetical protein